jgi:hypothetical protein
VRKVARSQIVDYQTYEDGRETFRRRIIEEVKPPRRVHVGPCLTFTFENAETIRYQIQEMMRTERIVRESDIRHELETYNAVLGGDGELGCCLLIEVEDTSERPRARVLAAWRALPDHVYVRFADGSIARARYDAAQVGDDRISSVQYMQFPVGARIPAAVGCDLPGLEAETPLRPEQVAALLADLAS